MAAKKTTRLHEEFVERHRSDMSVRDMAEELGLSRTTIQRIIRRLGAYNEPESAVEAVSASVKPAISGDELVLLKAHANLLWGRLQRAADKAIPALSREYRETLARITEMEQGTSAAGTADAKEVDVFDAISSGEP